MSNRFIRKNVIVTPEVRWKLEGRPTAKLHGYESAGQIEVFDGLVRATFRFPTYDPAKVILPINVHVVAARPDEPDPVGEGTITSVLQFADRLGTSLFPPHDPILGDLGPDRDIQVSVDIKKLFGDTEATIPSINLIPILEYPG